jgi:3'-phosphoadenosine 5'-phosphosulfate (PAPS) 3'-phosphatase
MWRSMGGHSIADLLAAGRCASASSARPPRPPTAAIVSGEADAYVHAGGQHAWDTAAPVAVALAAGAHVSRLDGSALNFDCAEPWTPDVLVCRPELRDAALRVLRRFT